LSDCGGSINHVVTLIGYDDAEDSGKGAWIVQNQWGTDWGDGGRIKLAYNTSSPGGVCQMFSWPLTIHPATSVSPYP